MVNERLNRSPTERWGNILAFLITLFINGLANGVPLGGQTTGEISDKYPSLFTPAGYVFSIWGLIYLGLAVFVIWQALPRQRSNKNLAAIRFPFLASCAANGLWIFAWHYDLLIVSLVLMFALLGSLIQIYRRLNIGLSNQSVIEHWVVHLPFSVYIGWITVATIANLSALQIDLGIENALFDTTIWTVIKIVVTAAIAATVLIRRHDTAFMLVTVWACAGIAVKNIATPLVCDVSSGIAVSGFLLAAYEFLRRSRIRRETG